MSLVDVAGLVLAGADGVIKVLAAIKRARDAHKRIPELVEVAERRINRICRTVTRYSQTGSAAATPREVFERVVEKFSDIKSALIAVQERDAKSKIRRFLSSEESASQLVDILARLGDLENHLDLYGLMAYAEDTRAAQFQEVTQAVQTAAVNSDSKVIIGMLKDMMLELQLAPTSVLGKRLSNGVTPPDEAMDAVEDRSLKACSKLEDTVRTLLETLSASGVSSETKQQLGAKIRALWDGWKIKLEAVKFARNRINSRVMIGEGASASVYKAVLTGEEVTIGSEPLRVAVKELRTQKWNLERRFPSFLREVFLQMDMDHPCVLKTYGAFWPEVEKGQEIPCTDYSDEGTNAYVHPFIVMERMSDDLASVIKKGLLGKVEMQRRVLLDVAKGIAYLHKRRVVHRDIKPENILLRTKDGDVVGHAKISDFGTSRHVQLSNQHTVYVRTIGAKGTYAYMPPEVLGDRENCVSRRSWDVWSFGVVACNISIPSCCDEMNEITPEDSKWMARSGDITRIMNGIADKINDEGIRRVVKMCLAASASDRPTMEAVVKVLEENKRSPSKAGTVLRMEKAANEGDVSAQYNLGLCYQAGKLIKRDNCEAVKWFQAASRGGHAAAKKNLADSYRVGVGVKQDMEKAALLYESAAHAGDVSAKSLLGYCYSRGYGVQRNFSKAIQLYKEAADAGCAQGQYHLGKCYEDGEGVEKNMKKAISLFESAARAGSEKACDELSKHLSLVSDEEV